MEKIVLNKSPRVFHNMAHGDGHITVPHYMSYEEQDLLTKLYVDSYFKNNRNKMIAEYEHKIALLDIVTNIEVEKNFNVDEVVYSDLFGEIVSHIRNYKSFRENLADNIEARKNERDNIALVISEFLYNKVSPMLEGLDLSDEKLGKISQLVSDFKNQIENTPAGAIMKEANKG